MIESMGLLLIGGLIGYSFKKEKTVFKYRTITEKPSQSDIKFYLREKEHKQEMLQLSEDDFHSIKYVEYKVNTDRGFTTYHLPVGELGSMSYLLNEKLQCYSGNGYHRINFNDNKASTGASEYSFKEHLSFIESGKANRFIINND